MPTRKYPRNLGWGLPNLALPCGGIPAGRDPLVNLKKIPNSKFSIGRTVASIQGPSPPGSGGIPSGGASGTRGALSGSGCPSSGISAGGGEGFTLGGFPPQLDLRILRQSFVVSTARGGGQQWSGYRGKAPHVGRKPGVGRFLCRYGGEGTPVPGDVKKFKL